MSKTSYGSATRGKRAGAPMSTKKSAGKGGTIERPKQPSPQGTAFKPGAVGRTPPVEATAKSAPGSKPESKGSKTATKPGSGIYAK